MFPIFPKINNNYPKCMPLIHNSRWKVTRPENNKENFTPVYKFPYIHRASILNRLKLYHTIFSTIAIPTSVICCSYGIVSPDIAGATILLGTCGAMPFYGFGIFPNKLIGYVYVNETATTIKVSYINFWGSRKNVLVPTKDVVPLSDLPTTPFDFLYLMFRRYSTTKTLKINLKYGHILDKERFNKVFLQT